MVPPRPRSRPEILVRTIAFVATLLMGIAAGCVWNAVEAMEEKFGRGKPHAIEKHQ